MTPRQLNRSAQRLQMRRAARRPPPKNRSTDEPTHRAGPHDAGPHRDRWLHARLADRRRGSP